MNRQRRHLLLCGIAAALLPLPSQCAAPAASRRRVLIVGGGFGGATCARTLRRIDPQIEVTLIEPRRHFYTGPFTNAAVASLCAEGDIVRGSSSLLDEGVRWIAQRATSLDPVTRRVRTDDGSTHQADRIVLSPGVEMRWDRIEGLDANTSAHMPHAWLGDAQVPSLRDRFEALRDGATIAIAAPANPYRCPPGPYERASLMAWRLTQQSRKRCKILICDAKDDFTKRALFQLGWDSLYPRGMIEWVPRADGGEVVMVDARRQELTLQNGSRIRADLASVIPPQRAAAIAHAADLVDESGWCAVNPARFESLRHPGVHVIGDAAAAHPMPKSAFSANSQAKLVALAIAADFAGRPAPEPKLVNTCYSLLAPDYGISVGGLYGVVSDRLSTLNDGTSPLSATREVRAREALYAHDWYEQITRDTFG
ncbi:MAG: FCSD flavin-binding domain-containing protein [Panacagrimonas sp.]